MATNFAVVDFAVVDNVYVIFNVAVLHDVAAAAAAVEFAFAIIVVDDNCHCPCTCSSSCCCYILLSLLFFLCPCSYFVCQMKPRLRIVLCL